MANTLNLGDGNWATKEDSLLAYNSENNNYKPLPFDFIRSSSATVVNKAGLIETVGSGEPRIDYKDDSKGALLLEPSRSNFITYSQDFSNAGWNTSSTRSVDFVPTSTIDPQGKTNAYRITSTASNNQVAIFGSIILGQTYTNSIYVRRVLGSGNVILRNVNNEENNFQLSVSDGWKRIETSATSTSIFGRLYINLQTVGDVIEIWGGQVEQGSYATSYIPTQGSIASRSEDVCNNGGNDQVINSTEGVLYVEIKGFTDAITPSRYISLSKDGESGFNNTLVIQHRDNGTLRVYVNGSATANIHFNIDIDFAENHKIAVLYKLNGYKLFVDGVEQSLFGTPVQTVFSGLDNLSFNLRTTGKWNGSIKDARVYNTELTDAQLQALTR